LVQRRKPTSSLNWRAKYWMWLFFSSKNPTSLTLENRPPTQFEDQTPHRRNLYPLAILWLAQDCGAAQPGRNLRFAAYGTAHHARNGHFWHHPWSKYQ
jgi:hypothetical protein